VIYIRQESSIWL